MQGHKLEADDFERLQFTLDWMSNHVNGSNYVMAEASTMFWSLLKACKSENGWPRTSHAFSSIYLRVLRELGCIQIEEMLSGGKNAYKDPERPQETTPLVKLLNKPLDREAWVAYLAGADPLAAALAENAGLREEVARLREQLVEAERRQ